MKKQLTEKYIYTGPVMLRCSTSIIKRYMNSSTPNMMQGIGVHAYDPSTWGLTQEDYCKLEARVGNTMSSNYIARLSQRNKRKKIKYIKYHFSTARLTKVHNINPQCKSAHIVFAKVLENRYHPTLM